MRAPDRDAARANAPVPDAPAHCRATSVDAFSRSSSMYVFDSFGDGEMDHERVQRVTPGIELERRGGDVPGRTDGASAFARLLGHLARRVRGDGGR